MDIKEEVLQVFWICVCTVGMTELIKRFFPLVKGKLAAAVTLAVGGIVSCVFVRFPELWEPLKVSLVGVSGAVVFYGTVFKLFKKTFSILEQKAESINSERKDGGVNGR